MKAKGILGILAAAAAVAAVGFYLYDPNLVRMTLGLSHTDKYGSYVGVDTKGADWAKPASLQAWIGPQIIAGVGKINDRYVKEFLQQDANRLLLAQWMMAQKFLDQQTLDAEKTRADKLYKDLTEARKANAAMRSSMPDDDSKTDRQKYNLKRSDDNLAALEKEFKYAHTLEEVCKQPGGAELLASIGNNLGWAEQFAFGNECIQPAVAVSILNDITQRGARPFESKMERDIATATALEYARSGWRHADAVARYHFYAKQYADGNLNSVFDTLPFWQRRMVCGCKGDNDFGSIESLEWLAENAKLPADQYPGSCWRCAYRLNNPYGESVHGSQYVAPFEEIYGRNRARFTAEIGGVCGSLSHFGAFAALANGVPATTAGEPGHCAYIVLVGDKWTPAYSLSWERGIHWNVWKDNWRYSSLHMATELFSAAQKEKTDLANAYRVIAGEKARQGKTQEAIDCYKAAVAAQPIHYLAWREYACLLAEKAADNKKAWCEYNHLICNKLVPKYPELADVLLSNYVYEPMAKVMDADTEGLQSELLRFWGCVNEMGPDRWRIEELIARHAKYSHIDEKDAASIIPFANRLIAEMANAKKYLPVILSWANSATAKLPEEKDKQAFLQAVVQGLGKVQGGAGKDVLAPLILAAEKARDISTFQKIGSMVGKDVPNAGIPKFEPFPGKLMSAGGLIWTSSTCQHDSPCEHPAVLKPQGGRFHSGKEVNPYVVAQLPKQTNLNGIVIVATAHNTWRLYDLHVQISETGNDDDWQDVAVFPKVTDRVMRIDLQEKRPLAKYVRVKRGGDKQEFFHLNGIYVYGVPAA